MTDYATRLRREVVDAQARAAGGLFGLPEPPSVPVDTSVAAAKRVRLRRDGDCARILVYLIAYGPQTEEQLREALQLHPNGVRGRLMELRRAGYVAMRDDLLHTNHSGCDAHPWQVTASGRAEVERLSREAAA